MSKYLRHYLLALVLSVLCMAATAQTQWVGTWATAVMPAQNQSMRLLTNKTLRQIVHVSTAGDKLRIRFTNEHGTESLLLSDAHVALSAGGSAIKSGTDHKVTFGGAASIRLAPGSAVYSDPVDLKVPALADLTISVYVPNQILRAETFHGTGLQTNYIADGNLAGAASLKDADTMTSWYFLSGVDVSAAADSRSIVAFGDSITDGARSTVDTNSRWPNALAEKLQKTPGFEHVGVLDMGIGGNRVLNDGTGPSALARFNRDVLAQSGVKYLIILESINDIGRLHPKRRTGDEDDLTANDLKRAIKQMVDEAHGHGIKVYGATLTPYSGAGYYTAKGEKVRQEINNWIRTSGVFDGAIDFEKVVGDGAKIPVFNPSFDSGDHLHPSDAGYKAMGESIDPNLFK